MSIQWKSYIAAATEKLSAVAFPDTQEKLKSKPVSSERQGAAALLEHLSFDDDCPIITSDRGFLVALRAENDRHIVYYRRDSDCQVEQSVGDFCKKYERENSKFIDAHFFFLVKELDIPLLPNVTAEYIGERIGCDEKGEASMDFDEVIKCHGSFFSWKVDDSTSLFKFLELMTWDLDKKHSISFSVSTPEYGISKAKATNPNIQIVDLSRLCQAITNPIASAVDKTISHASISLVDPEYLSNALVNIHVSKEGLVFGAGGGVCFRFTQEGRNCIALSLRNFHNFEVEAVLETLLEIGVDEVEFEDTHFLSFIMSHGQYLDISREYLSHPAELENSLDINSTLTTQLGNVVACYEDIRVFDLNQVPNASPWTILCYLATRFKSARSPFIPDGIIEISERLLKYPVVPFENIYLSLSASHWKHAFIEVYRVIEGLYYFGWMHAMKQSFNSQEDEYELYLKLQEQLSWKYKERASIAKLFQLIPRSVLSDYDPLSISSISDRFETQEDISVMAKFANLVYSIRNSNVHQGESDEGLPIAVSANCWPKLTCCLFLIIEHLYSVHGSGMPRLFQAQNTADIS